MAVLGTITIPNGDVLTTLAAAALEDGYTANQAGVQAMVIAFLKERYRRRKQQAVIEASEATRRTDIQAALVTADANAPGIV